MYERHLRPKLEAALKTSPVVFIAGARQVGKSTLVQQALPNYAYFSFDDASVLATARRDPQTFIRGLDKAILDEVQLLPELARGLKLEVDRNRSPGRFVLTGSANLLVLPHLADALVGRMTVGRMTVLTLYPLSQGELQGKEEGFIDWLFAKNDIKI